MHAAGHRFVVITSESRATSDQRVRVAIHERPMIFGQLPTQVTDAWSIAAVDEVLQGGLRIDGSGAKSPPPSLRTRPGARRRAEQALRASTKTHVRCARRRTRSAHRSACGDDNIVVPPWPRISSPYGSTQVTLGGGHRPSHHRVVLALRPLVGEACALVKSASAVVEERVPDPLSTRGVPIARPDPGGRRPSDSPRGDAKVVRLTRVPEIVRSSGSGAYCCRDRGACEGASFQPPVRHGIGQSPPPGSGMNGRRVG